VSYDDNPWPIEVLQSARRVFDPLGQRTFRTLDKRIQHAFKVWHGRYEMNPEQSRYAAQLLSACFAGADEIPVMKDKMVYVLTRIDKATHHDDVHRGMMKRSSLVDVSEQLADFHNSFKETA